MALARPEGRHGGHRLVERVEPGVGGDVALAAVAEGRHDRQTLLLAGLHHAMFGISLEADDSRIVFAWSRRTVFQPEGQEAIGRGAGLHPLTAAMGHGQRRLEQEQALFGGERRDPPRLGALDDRRVVGLGLEAEQRELESPLAMLGAVTGSLVAAQLRQHGLDLVAEADRSRPREPAHLDRQARPHRTGLHDEFTRPIRDRPDCAVGFDLDPTRRGGGQMRLGREIALRTVGRNAQDHQALRGFRPEKPNPGREDLEALD